MPPMFRAAAPDHAVVSDDLEGPERGSPPDDQCADSPARRGGGTIFQPGSFTEAHLMTRFGRPQMKLRHIGAAALSLMLLAAVAASAQPATTDTADAAVTPSSSGDLSLAAMRQTDREDRDEFPWGLLGLAGLGGLFGLRRRRQDRQAVESSVDGTRRP